MGQQGWQLFKIQGPGTYLYMMCTSVQDLPAANQNAVLAQRWGVAPALHVATIASAF